MASTSALDAGAQFSLEGFLPMTVGASVLLALGAALLLNEPFRGRGLARVLVLLPWAVAPVVAAKGAITQAGTLAGPVAFTSADGFGLAPGSPLIDAFVFTFCKHDARKLRRRLACSSVNRLHHRARLMHELL